jgi:hypothetical protein
MDGVAARGEILRFAQNDKASAFSLSAARMPARVFSGAWPLQAAWEVMSGVTLSP